MTKLPAIQFYFGDWKKDAELSMCSLATKGFWFELLGAMHELGRSGQITGTAQQLSRVCRCTAAEAEDAIRELAETQTATVMERNGNYTIINRRMKREFKEREQVKERVNKFRKKESVTLGNKKVTQPQSDENKKDMGLSSNGNENVTSYSSSSSSINVTNVTKSETSSDAVATIFTHWQTRLNHPHARLTTDRRRRIAARLKEGFTVDQLKAAVDGCAASPFHRGENDHGTIFDSIDLIFRNGEKVEQFASFVQKQQQAAEIATSHYCENCQATNGLTKNEKGWTKCSH
jgi:hypothetical protein